MSAVRIGQQNPKGSRLNNSERKMWIDDDKYLNNKYKSSPLSLTKFIKKHKSEIDDYIKGNLNSNIPKGGFRNPLELPHVRSMASSPMGNVNLDSGGLGRYSNPNYVAPIYLVVNADDPDNADKLLKTIKLSKGAPRKTFAENPAKRTKLNFKFVELYRGYDIHKFKNRFYVYDSQKPNTLLEQTTTLAKAREQINYYHDSGLHPLGNPNADTYSDIYNNIEKTPYLTNYTNRTMDKNPLHHYPKTRRGRPRKVGRPKSPRRSTTFPRGKGRLPQIKYFILDLYNSSGKLANTLIGQGTLQTAKIEAQQFSTKRGISKVELSGPYSKRPTKTSARI